MSETLRVVRLPKSKMQTLREYTNRRAFAEIGEDGSPVAYFIEAQDGVEPKPTKIKRRPRVSKRATLRLTTGNNPYAEGSDAHKGFAVASAMCPCSRYDLERMFESELGIDDRQACSLASYMIFSNPVLRADE